jgi:hypothetical protein
MMDFYTIKTQETRKGVVTIFADFKVVKSKDLMVRGGDFYAFWDDESKTWSRDIFHLYSLIDKDVVDYCEKLEVEGKKNVKLLADNSSRQAYIFKEYLRNINNNFIPLDGNLTFANTVAKKKDYRSHNLPYSLEPGDHSAWDELVGVLYSPEELAKIEWAIGAIVSGDSKLIQKFLVLYGSSGTGKSTVLNIIERLFQGYTTTFDAKSLGKGDAFATSAFRENPLVAIEHDGDLSRIEDNSLLNTIIAHETVTINDKYAKKFDMRLNSFLFMGTNSPVKITESRSGLLRRLIDVEPTGHIHSFDHYQNLMSRIEFELGAIAYHCQNVYRNMGKNYYDSYRPERMMYSTNVFYNFMEASFDEMKHEDGITLKRAWALYKEYCTESGNTAMKMQTFREEMREYFKEFHKRTTVRGEEVTSLFKQFKTEKLEYTRPYKISTNGAASIFVLDQTTSLLDDILKDCPAQYANKNENPTRKWVNVKTKLSDLDTSRLHFVKIPENHIVIDFDLKDTDGNKSYDLNLEAIQDWPPTYAELSKGGQGIHLHYIYHGDVSKLANEYSPGIEIKTLMGDASLRRRLSMCNNVPVSIISSGLPLKEKRVLDEREMKSERSLRELIARNLRKEIHPGTKPSIDFIKKILDDAYESGMSYDVTDLRPRIIAFANNSTNRPLECLKIVMQMQFKSVDHTPSSRNFSDSPIVFFDVEVYPNLFVVCWKYQGSNYVVRMINPTSEDVESLFKARLIGFNNRRYDNHILYARFIGYDNERLFKLSQSLISDKNNAAMFGEAYGVSYADIYDFSSKKQGLKKFQIELGLKHMELDLPWDQPVPENMWFMVAEYCENDVLTTEEVFNARSSDFVARKILAELSGLTVNDTTQKHTAKIIFGNDPAPSRQFVYTDLSTLFEGYVFDAGRSTYRGEDPSEGGYVYAEPGIYENVAVLDVASMHPTSICLLNLFGPYTKNFKELLDARLAIKHGDFASASRMMNGKLKPLLSTADPEETAETLSHALKIIINIVYGLTSAKFDNPFRDIRNKDNIVAKRGALFMIDLKHFVQENLGAEVVHIKTDSIKIPNATPEIIENVKEFGLMHGYTFEHEKTYEKFCLVNDAVYVARDGDHWDAVGAQFQHPYVFKSLFTDQAIEFDDMIEVKSVMQGAIYLDWDRSKEVSRMRFIGRTGAFIPVVEDGGDLYRVKEEKLYALPGTKGYSWKEAEVVRELGPNEWMKIDRSYFEKLVNDAKATIEKFGDLYEFIYVRNLNQDHEVA